MEGVTWTSVQGSLRNVGSDRAKRVCLPSPARLRPGGGQAHDFRSVCYNFRDMGRSCTICAHSERRAIDEALGTSRALRHIADQFGVSKAAVHRHWKAHVLQGRPVQSPTGGEIKPPASTAPPAHRSFWSRVKTVAKWTVGVGLGVGYAWLVATAPQPTSGAKGQAGPRV